MPPGTRSSDCLLSRELLLFRKRTELKSSRPLSVHKRVRVTRVTPRPLLSTHFPGIEMWPPRSLVSKIAGYQEAVRDSRPCESLLETLKRKTSRVLQRVLYLFQLKSSRSHAIWCRVLPSLNRACKTRWRQTGESIKV